MNSAAKAHWDRIYANNPITRLGWYEAVPTPSLQLIEACEIPRDAILVDIGSGVSTLIPHLLELGYKNLCAVDISGTALQNARSELGPERAARVRWLEADITAPSALAQLENAAVWHDRAVFHFLNSAEDRQTYHAALENVLKPGGFVILATFAPGGAEKCSGLAVNRCSPAYLSQFLGQGYNLLESMDYTYHMPSGDLRPYVYARFKRLLPC